MTVVLPGSNVAVKKSLQDCVDEIALLCSGQREDEIATEIVVQDYPLVVAEHYGIEPQEVDTFEQLGLRIHLPVACTFSLYDGDLKLIPVIRYLVQRFGVVSFTNVLLDATARSQVQKNIFPNLAFHLDRGAGFANQYSFFVRDPFDELQHEPRKSSTLILPRHTTELQARREGKEFRANTTRVDLFHDQEIEHLLDSLMIEQGWRAPEGVGEFCVFDNRTVFHASYHHDRWERGYQIGVRYLF